MIATLLLVARAGALATGRLAVCTNKPCRTHGSHDTLRLATPLQQQCRVVMVVLYGRC